MPIPMHSILTGFTLLATATSPSALVANDVPTPNAQSFLRGNYFNKVIRISGTVVAVTDDELDPGVTYLALDCDGSIVHVFTKRQIAKAENLYRLIGGQIEVTGISFWLTKGARRFLGPIIDIREASSFRILKNPPADPFAVPALEDLRGIHPDIVSRLGMRRTTGTVLAVWKTKRFLLNSDDHRIINVELSSGQRPSVGSHVEIVGRVQTDGYHIILSHAAWKAAAGEPCPLAPPTDVAVDNLLVDANGETMIQAGYHGKLIRLRGRVCAVSQDLSADNRINLDWGGFVIAVEGTPQSDTFADIVRGMTVEVVGVCLMENGPWSSRAPIPPIERMSLLVRNRRDIRVLSRPPWWTVRRLFALVAALAAGLVAFFIWNRILNRLVERRSRALLRNRISLDEANVKFEERTRLAVELHDTLSQSLTGVSLEIDAARMAVMEDPSAVGNLLDSVSAKMKNCRENLRQCLWDLRNHAYEEPELASAIRRTVAPFADKARLDIICPLRTNALSDNTIHHTLCIVRELVANAVRHGKAASISVSVSRESGGLAIRVADDGVGFDPDSRPGTRQGHFGLQGVLERVRRLGGRLSLASRIGRGTTVSIVNINPEG